jgi:hypothetical protein
MAGAACRRRIDVAQVMWSLPGLTIAAQAFLFTIGLDPGASSSR